MGRFGWKSELSENFSVTISHFEVLKNSATGLEANARSWIDIFLEQSLSSWSLLD